MVVGVIILDAPRRPEGRALSAITASFVDSFVRSCVRRETSFSVILPAGSVVRLCSRFCFSRSTQRPVADNHFLSLMACVGKKKCGPKNSLIVPREINQYREIPGDLSAAREFELRAVASLRSNKKKVYRVKSIKIIWFFCFF